MSNSKNFKLSRSARTGKVLKDTRRRPSTTAVEQMPKRGKAYGADDARAHLPELLERAHHGASTVITKRGRPYAVLGPLGSNLQVPRLLLATLKGSGAGLWGQDSSQTVDALRTEWE